MYGLSYPFRDKNGNIVIGQMPNWPMWLFILLVVVTKVSTGMINELSVFASRMVIIYWSLLEIFSGVNLWRRFLGATVLAFVLYGIMGSKLG